MVGSLLRRGDTAVKLLESTCVVTELPGDLPARLVEVIAELANAEQNPARRHVLEAVSFWTGLVEDDPEMTGPLVHGCTRRSAWSDAPCLIERAVAAEA